jgi:hypothetical protein
MTLKQIYNSINKKEWQLVFWLTLFVIIITTIPLIFGYITAPKDKMISGLHSLTPIDMNVYYSYIEQVKQGRILFVDLFTSEIQKPVVFNLFWFGVGYFGKIFHLDSITTFHLIRILLIPVFTSFIYFFIAYFFEDKNKRKIALLFILFSSGVGTFALPILDFFVYEIYGYYHWPFDLWVPEAITFLTLFHMPHFIASLILILLIFLLTILTWEKKNLKYELGAGLCALILFQFHPFHLPTVFGVLGAYFGIWSFINKKILWNKLRPLIILFLFALPNLIYHFYTLQDPIIKQRALQNICLSPVWWLGLIGFGFLIPFSLLGIYTIFKKNNPEIKDFKKDCFLVVWLITQTFLIYSPTFLQRRMSEGIHIPLSFLTVVAIFYLYDQAKNNQLNYKLTKLILKIEKDKLLMLLLFVFLFAFSNLFNIARDIMFYTEKHEVFYLSKEEKTSFEWIKNNTDINSVFIGHPTNANFIAGQAGRFIFAGHGTESLYFESKEKQVQWFYSTSAIDEKKINFLKENRIDYVYYSQKEKEFDKKNIFNPEEKKYLEKVYSNSDVVIYKLNLQ